MDTPDILREFEQLRATYTQFAERLRGLLHDLLVENGIRVHSVTARAKSRESFRSKLRRPDSSYSSIADLTDLAGVRVITYFADDVDRVGKLIEAEFAIDRENSVDKRTTLDPDRFGYLSLHYVVQLSAGRAQLTENRRYPLLKAELQVRSILQHAWAEMEHDLGYKGAAEVPRHIRRRFSRVAGLLELADQEFVAMRDELAAYERAVPQQIIERAAMVSLDRASVTAFVQEDPEVMRLDQAIAGTMGAELEPFDPERANVERLRMLGMETIGQLRSALEARAELIRRFASRWVRSKQQRVNRGISLFYLRYVMLAETKDSALAKRVLTGIFPRTGTKDEMISRVFTIYDEIAAG